MVAAWVLACCTWASLALGEDVASAQTGSPLVAVEPDVQYGQAGGVNLLMDVYTPILLGTPPFPAVVLVHGGGFYSGDKADGQDRYVAVALAEAGYVVASINYRLAPEFPFPAADEDAQQAVAFVRQQAARFGVDPSRIGIAGESAGSTIAGYVAYKGKGPLDVGSRVAAVVTYSGPFDLPAFATKGGNTFDIASGGHDWLTGPDILGQAKAASPITYVDATDPPIFMTNSEQEQTPLYQAQEMQQALEQLGVPAQLLVLPGSEHALGGPNANLVLPATIAFFDRYLAGFGGPTPETSAQGGRPRRLIVLVILALLILVPAGAIIGYRSGKRAASGTHRVGGT